MFIVTESQRHPKEEAEVEEEVIVGVDAEGKEVSSSNPDPVRWAKSVAKVKSNSSFRMQTQTQENVHFGIKEKKTSKPCSMEYVCMYVYLYVCVCG